MARFRLWFVWLLAGRTLAHAQRAESERQAREIVALKAENAEFKAALGEVISELAHLRNAIPETVSRRPAQAIQRVNSWRAFRAAIETRPQTIHHEMRQG